MPGGTARHTPVAREPVAREAPRLVALDRRRAARVWTGISLHKAIAPRANLSRRPRDWALLLLVSVLTGGCARTLLDVRDLQVPVMMNRLPLLDAAWTVGTVRPVEIVVQKGEGAILLPSKGYELRERNAETDAKMGVFQAVAQISEPALSEVQLDVFGAGFNFGFLFFSAVGVKATGNVVSIDRSPLGATLPVVDAGRMSERPLALPSTALPSTADTSRQ
jgi:hypothetical protein